jgi:hypothetical protein
MTHPTIDYLRRLFGPATLQPVFICSLVNGGTGSNAGVRSIHSRDHQAIYTFVNRWDRPGRGLYYCMSTIGEGKPRNKDNCLETPAFVIDVDFKDLDCEPATAENLIRSLRLPPTGIIRTGHGLHCVWMLKEALATHEVLSSIETVLRQLCDVIGGDLAVAHPAALLRLPGSHNSKNGEWTEVEVVSWADRFYELDDLEEWLGEQSVVIKRKIENKSGNGKLPPSNPYLEAAEQIGFKPPVDVAQRLEQMTYMGAGDAGVHITQLQVSASLIKQGVPQGEVIDLLLAASRCAAGEYGARWNWAREQRNIEKMCVGAFEKYGSRKEFINEIKVASEVATEAARSAERGPEEAVAAERQPDRPEQAGNIVDFGAAREAVVAKAKGVAQQVKGKKFKRISEAVKEVLGEEFMFLQDVAWRCEDGRWILVDNFKSWINVEIQKCADARKEICTINLRNEVRADIEADEKFRRDSVPWNRHGLIPTLSGLVDPSSLAVRPATPSDYCSWWVPVKFNWEAPCPLWTRMLADCFPDDDEKDNIKSIQQLMGAGLWDDRPRGLRRAMILHGSQNCGKSAILTVCEALFGGSISVELDQVEDGKHQLTPFLRRLPWILHEAFDQSTWHTSSIVKSLITGDQVTAEIKCGPHVPVTYTGPVFWGTNHAPKFKENTEAIISRILPIHCQARFDDENPVGVAKWALNEKFAGPGHMVAAKELEGVLAWAVDGLRQARMRGSIVISAESVETKKEIYREANLVEGFIEECADIDKDWEISHVDFYLAVLCWYVFNFGDGSRRTPSSKQIGMNIKSLSNPAIGQRKGTDGVRLVTGIRLNDKGGEYHKHGRESEAYGKVAIGASAGDPNRYRPRVVDGT